MAERVTSDNDEVQVEVLAGHQLAFEQPKGRWPGFPSSPGMYPFGTRSAGRERSAPAIERLTSTFVDRFLLVRMTYAVAQR